MLVDTCLEESAVRHPEKVALVCEGRRLTYRELDDATNRFAGALLDAGVRAGDVVVIYLENSVDAVVAIFGTLRMGGVFVPVGSTVKADKLAYILQDSSAVAFVTDPRAEPVVSVALQAAPGVRTTILTGGRTGDEWTGPAGTLRFDAMVAETRPPVPPPTRRIDLDLAALVYTSGSTGRPKGVILSHANIVAAAASIGEYLQNTEDDVVLDVLPLSFDYGLYQLFLAFQAGARLVLERSFVYPTVVLDLLEREQVTGLPLVPTLAALLLKHDLKALGLRLRYVTNTGAALPPAHIAALREQLPAVRIFSMYGLTECKRVSFLAPEEIDVRPTSVGKPMDNVEVYVEDETGSLNETGEGELIVRGSNVMGGYWRAPEATERALRPGFYPGERLLRTGDRFLIDHDGYMYFRGRLDDVIKSRGQRVSPKEVENAIYALRDVTGVAVVGVPDPILGMAITAFVSTMPGSDTTEQDVLRHCARHLEDFMVPKTVTLVEALPTTESGKIDRRRMQVAPSSSSAA